jgi:hypothetical protein
VPPSPPTRGLFQFLLLWLAEVVRPSPIQAPLNPQGPLFSTPADPQPTFHVLALALQLDSSSSPPDPVSWFDLVLFLL